MKCRVQLCLIRVTFKSLLRPSVAFVYNRMLQEDPVLFQLYKDLVVSQVISADEFWANHLSNMKNESVQYNNKQDVGISGAFLVSTSCFTPSSVKMYDCNTHNPMGGIFLKVNAYLMLRRQIFDLRQMAAMV